MIMVYIFGGTLWHPRIPRCTHQETPVLWQLNHEFNNYRSDISWHDCHFVLRLQFTCIYSTELNVIGTNAIFVTLREHYSDVIMSAMASKTPASRLFAQPFVQVQIKENIKVPRHWPLWGESTGDHSPNKGPVTRKIFPFDDVIMNPRSRKNVSNRKTVGVHRKAFSLEVSCVLSKDFNGNTLISCWPLWPRDLT